MWPESEKELAHAVVLWLQNWGWEVYQEVQVYRYSRVADIVATQNNLLWVIEVKKSLTLAVMEQADWWTHYAHLVSVAVPRIKAKRYGKNSGMLRVRAFAERVIRKQGIGLLQLEEPYKGYKTEEPLPGISEGIRPKFRRKILSNYLNDVLIPDLKAYGAEAGNAEGDFYTPFKATANRIIRYVKKNPGTTLKEMLNDVDTHYASVSTAKQCIPKWIQQGVIKGITLKMDGRTWRLYPNDKEAT